MVRWGTRRLNGLTPVKMGIAATMSMRWTMMGIMGFFMMGCTVSMAFHATWDVNPDPLPSLSNGISAHPIATLSIRAGTDQSFAIQVSSGLGRYLIREGDDAGRDGDMAPYTIRLTPMGERPFTHQTPMTDRWVSLESPVEWVFSPTGDANQTPMRVALFLSSPPNPSLFRGQFRANISINVTEMI